MIASDIDLDHGKTSQEQVQKYPLMNLGTKTNLQSQSHNRGQTTLGLDYASISPRQVTCDFSYWDKMSILQMTLWKIDALLSTAKPTALNRLDCT